MEEQPQIVNADTPAEKPNDTAAQNKNKSPLKKKWDTIFTIIFSVCIFLAVFAAIYYLGTGKSILPINFNDIANYFSKHVNK